MPKYLLAAGLALAMNSFAQFGQLQGNLRVTGEVRHEPSAHVDDLGVELYDQNQHQVIERAHVMNDGAFEFRNVSAGTYEVRLVSRYGDKLRSEYVNVNQGSESVVFQMGDSTKKALSGAVDISQLEHQVNRKALREYRLAAKTMATGDVVATILHIEKSIEADPQFAEAHHQLGVALMNQRQPERALEELRKATTLDPALAVGHANMAIVLMKLNRAGEAETAARRAIQLDPAIAKAHFVLALSLLGQRKTGKEVLDNLRLASAEFPQARAMCSKLEAGLTAAN